MPSDTTREQLLKKPIDLAEYLFTRLKQLGIDSLHGLPGDYNLVALDYLPKVGLSWVGNCNELNASYAADGYARVKGIGAVLTTFGVGELSALNGIAGAYSERVPVVHIVGTPSTLSQKNGMLLHHTLGNGNFKVFADMSKELACATANLRDPYDAAGQIDHVLEECWRKSLPVYITLPTDMVQKKVEGEKLDTPLDLSFPPNNPEQEDYAVEVILRSLYQAEDPVVLIDACAIRHRVLDEVHEFLEKTKIPVYVTPMGKGAIDETIDQYAGVYAGEGSQPQVREKFESADLVIRIGSIASDFNTSGFSYKTSQLNIIDLHSSHVAVRYSHYPGTHFKGVLQKMTKKVDLSKLSIKTPAKVRNAVKENDDGTPTITQDYLWPRVGEFFKENDVVVTETGTANFGIWDSLFPSGVTALSQVLWGSIGWSVGACQGAAQAVKDNGSNRRVILFVGDGSFQLTVQELSTMLRRGLKPIIFVICNDGYEIERCIHGETAEYNFISNWKYKDLVNTFRGEDVGAKTFQVKTKDELEKLLTDQEFNAAKVLQFVELYLPKKNAPRALVLTAERAAANNARVE